MADSLTEKVDNLCQSVTKWLEYEAKSNEYIIILPFGLILVGGVLAREIYKRDRIYTEQL